MRAETLHVEGRRVRCWRDGVGPPLVLLHGGMADAAFHWSRIWDRLAGRFDVIAPDLPGFGESQGLPRSTIPDLIVWLDRLIAVADRGAVGLVGNAFGADLARGYAASHPLNCQALVLINGGALPSLADRARAALPLGDGPANAGAASRARSMVADHALLTSDFVAACQGSVAINAIMRQATRGPAPRRAPTTHTLVLWGEEDQVAPPAVGLRLAAQLPNAAFRLIPGVGRLPPVEAPDETADALFAFLG